MVTSSLSEAKIRKVLGLGYWVQGFRCFPWMAVNFFLKDGLQVDPSTLQLLQNSANLPMIGKPLYGVVSDAVYIAGQHRIPYLALGGTPTSFHFFVCISFQFLNYPAAQNFKFSYDWLHSNNTITCFALFSIVWSSTLLIRNLYVYRYSISMSGNFKWEPSFFSVERKDSRKK